MILLIPLIWSCRGTSNLAEDEYLYKGGDLEIESPVNIKNERELLTDLENHIRPEPNMAILGMRPKLWFYNIFDTVKKEKGFKHWVKHKLGEPPVLLQDVNQERVASTLTTAFENEGFFETKVDYATDTSRKTASVTYTATVDPPYSFGEIYLPQGNSALAKAIRAGFNNSNIESGERFNLKDLHEERLRLEEVLQNKGFYYYNDSYLLYQLDSTAGDRKVDVFFKIKNETPSQAERIQQINNVVVNTDFDIMDTVKVNYDTTQVDGITYVRQEEKFRPDEIVRHIRLRENDIYTRWAEEITISRLIDLGVFKYVNIYFEDAGRGKLNSFLRLSPMKKKSIRLELQGVTKSNSFVGPFFQASFTNRNVFKGAELYQLTLNTGYEWQMGGGSSGENLNSYELGIRNTLRVPRFITPFRINYFSSRYVPQTYFELGFRMLQRVNYFRLNSFDLGYGFRWRESITKTHRLYPVDVHYIRISNKSAEFENLLAANPFMRRSYENQFILGSTYSFTYNSQSKKENIEKRHNFYFNGNLDISGNLMHLLKKTVGNEEPAEDESNTIFGSAYSQFVRTDFDFRYYHRFNRGNKIASRFIFGIGIPYGNSLVLPYTKQFTIGGSSSIRAFRARSLGPGAFKFEPDSFNIFFDQTADIKIETNLEYRFDLVGSFKGAAFVDAGNIWTIKEDLREGQFGFDSFLSEIAVGAGLGVRLDIQFFVLRLDFATPLRVPSRDPGDRWNFALTETNEQGEKVNNIMLNIAIGYPF
jgi:outer membrane protein insertion porin family